MLPVMVKEPEWGVSCTVTPSSSLGLKWTPSFIQRNLRGGQVQKPVATEPGRGRGWGGEEARVGTSWSRQGLRATRDV